MKALVILREDSCAWVGEFFPKTHPLLIPVCNKPLAEYRVDFAILSGCTAIRFALDDASADLETYLGNGDKWGIPISHLPFRSGDSVETILAKNKGFQGDDSLLVMDGLFFLHYDRRLDYAGLEHALAGGAAVTCATGSLQGVGGSPGDADADHEVSLPTLTPIESVNDIYQLSMDILQRQSAQYVLPGYSRENGVFIGRNVILAKTAVIDKPVMLGDNVQVRPGAEIGPGAVIGSDVIIGANSKARHAVVMDRTYIGEELDLTDKMACGNKLIAPEAGLALDIEDAHLLSSMARSGTGGLLQRLTHGFTALVIMMALALPYVLLVPLLVLLKKWQVSRESIIRNPHGDDLSLKRVTIDTDSLIGRMARALSLDRYHLLFRVFGGTLRLIGNTMTPAEAMDAGTLAGFEQYAPGVFSYAEAEGWPSVDFDPEISDRFFMRHSTATRDISMTFNALLSRMHSGNLS